MEPTEQGELTTYLLIRCRKYKSFFINSRRIRDYSSLCRNVRLKYSRKQIHVRCSFLNERRGVEVITPVSIYSPESQPIQLNFRIVAKKTASPPYNLRRCYWVVKRMQDLATFILTQSYTVSTVVTVTGRS
jgi:hypothetical protein